MPIQAWGFKSVGCFTLDSNGVGHHGRSICGEEAAHLMVAGKQRERERRGQAPFQGQFQVTQLPPTGSSVLEVPPPPGRVTGWEPSLQQAFREHLSLQLLPVITDSLWSTNGSRGFHLALQFIVHTFRLCTQPCCLLTGSVSCKAASPLCT